MRSTRVRGTSIFLASAPADSLSGTRNSSRRTSPGCMGASFLIIADCLLAWFPSGPRAGCLAVPCRDVLQYDISFIISRLRSKKSLCHEGYVVGPDAAYAESVRLLKQTGIVSQQLGQDTSNHKSAWAAVRFQHPEADGRRKALPPSKA